MSRRNKERRAANRRRKEARANAQRASRSRRRAELPDLDDLLRSVVYTRPFTGADLAQIRPLIVEHGEAARTAVHRWFGELLDTLWHSGWTPGDLVRVVERTSDTGHADLVAHAIAVDAYQRSASRQALHPRWRRQLEELRKRADRACNLPLELLLGRAVPLLRLIAFLEPITPTLSPPGTETRGGGGLDERVLARVRALLAKAESTEFDEEAEALTAKAQELIARHAIDEALLQTPDEVGAPSARRIPVEAPYADAKASLLHVIAEANRCRAVHSDGYGWVTVFGYDADLDAVELLAASLLAQATAAMVRHGSRRDAAGRSRTRSFRNAFLLGFATRVGQRLREATDTGVAEADQARLLPVLAVRRDHLDRAVADAFPHLHQRRRPITNGSGWSAGHAAADRADLNVPSGMLSRD